MAAEKAGQYVCLTTLDYAVRGSLMSTHCPSCGLRLIIKHDSVLNRVTSISLLLGMSLLIGYNLGAHGRWVHKISTRLLKLLGFGGGNDSSGNSKTNQTKLNRDQIENRNQESSNLNSRNYVQSNGKFATNDSEFSEGFDETQMSDLTCDSAIDIREGLPEPEDDLEEQLIEILTYNDFYTDMYTNNGPNDSESLTTEEGDESPRSRLRTQTVDRIDQVLHQIDDIKKSIVEIDDELYHIAGSTYANFNPDFLTLSSTIVDEFDKDEDMYESTPRHKLSEDQSNQSKVHLEEVSRRLKFIQSESKGTKSSEKPHAPSDTLCSSGSRSHASFSDVDSLQLEWDFDFESGYDYYDAQKTDSDAKAQDRTSQSPLREKLSSVANGLDMPMTDEQKLKNMHDLLDEAKKQGLLNNIIDALAPSESTLSASTHRKLNNQFMKTAPCNKL